MQTNTHKNKQKLNRPKNKTRLSPFFYFSPSRSLDSYLKTEVMMMMMMMMMKTII